MSKQKTTRDSEIIKAVLEKLDINANKLANLLECSSLSSVYHIVNGKQGLSEKMKARIIDKFPNVSYAFLSTNQGPVLLNEDEEFNAKAKLFTNLCGTGGRKTEKINGIINPKNIAFEAIPGLLFEINENLKKLLLKK